jgi:methylmalonyl-CoA/ethylmalonyl-CoA epimerase
LRNRACGLHHLCFGVDDIRNIAARLKAVKMRIWGGGERKWMLTADPILVVDPADFHRSLMEFEQAR